MYEKYKEYALKVVNGEITTGRLIRLACQRYLDWFHNPDYEFRPDEVDKIISIISKMRHFSGKSAGKNFILEPWQKWIVYNIYGWYNRTTGLRVVNKVFILVARKNGKSALIAALSLAELLLGESGGQVYNIASSREQAKLLFDMESTFGKGLDPKHKHMKFQRDRIYFNAKVSYSRCLASDTGKLDGLNPSFFVCDETHAYPDSKIWDVLISGQGFRENPLGIQISTAGFTMFGFCHSYRQMCIDILEGLKQDDTQFAAIYELDENDDWTDESKWVKANPNLDVTVTRKYLREQVTAAKNQPSLEVGVKTKNFNYWVQSKAVWITNDLIQRQSGDVSLDDFKDKPIYVGVDLASVSDITAVTLLAEDGDRLITKTFYFLPSSCFENNTNAEKYKQWSKTGELIICPGNVTDYNVITNHFLNWRENLGLNIYAVFYDNWNSTQWAVEMTENNFNMVPYSQSLGNFNRATKEFERGVKQGKIVIDNNEITRWMFSNVALKFDFNENCKPIKGGDESGKIDGVISNVEALGGYLTEPHYSNII